MSKLFISSLFVLSLSGTAVAGITASEIAPSSFSDSVGMDERDAAEHSRKRVIGLRRFVLCVDGLKLFQTVGPSASGAYGSSGYNLNPSLSTIQLFEERDGKSVPATCQEK
ncbi:hypothetical protein [Thiorhodovibrio frisius]|uniref:Uncharacterized protein n=1 Tax=Thiorhodovibrio frisius TaxID=631362 RepID=H8Z4L4_9GAMM|nr:hypothetical protein [Thiorhodovibrio frisius]EIC20271.1 hypothetical protein Thi970DRAFT_03895 [Thiorhodovibrio frisius]WPL21008.1 hypothetical protein Thiofri_01115 [Thiorhodovibrio frisius]